MIPYILAVDSLQVPAAPAPPARGVLLRPARRPEAEVKEDEAEQSGHGAGEVRLGLLMIIFLIQSNLILIESLNLI